MSPTNFSQPNADDEQHNAPKKALNRLREGNQRFVDDQPTERDTKTKRREAVAAQQFPFATVLCCSDARVSPDIIFDQDIGDLFIVRVAGNIAKELETESIEYSIKVLKSTLILVLGHENCGAVMATLAKQTADIPTIAAALEPAIQKSALMKGSHLVNAIQTNVHLIVEQLKHAPDFQDLIKQGKLRVIGGYYNLQTGKVDFFDDLKKSDF
jgi:carbonic anhydrase